MILDTPKLRNIARENGKIHQEIIEHLRPLLKVGTCGKDINEQARKLLGQFNAESAFLGQYGFPAYIIVSINEVVVHGIPDDSIFQDGDKVTIDFGVKKNRLLTDAAFTVVIGPHPNPEYIRCIRSAKEALGKGLQQAVAGNRVGDIGYAIGNHIAQAGFHIIRSLTGHGLGESIHGHPIIYNYGEQNKGSVLKDGMYVAIEPIVGLTTGEVYEEDFAIKMKDGNIGVQEEHCGIITREGFEIIV